MRTHDDLHDYQLDAIDFIKNGYHTNLWLDPGAGKTVVTLTALAELEAFPALIVAPLRVAQTVWEEEAAEWKHLQHLTFSKVLGAPGARKAALNAEADIYIINYENLTWLTKQHAYDPRNGVQQPAWDVQNPFFQAIVWDEISKMKGRGVRWKAARKGARNIQTRIGLTGTPRGNHLLGLWAQVHLLDRDDILGRNYTAYKREYFYQADFQGYDWQPFPGAEEKIMNAISHATYRMSPWAQLDEPIHNPITVDLGPELLERYQAFEKTLLLEAAEKEIEAVSAGVLVNKLRQFAAGAVYDREREATLIHTAKYEALQDLIEELQGEPLLVFYEYDFQREWLINNTDFPDLRSDGVIDQWNAGKLSGMVAHPASAGHGLNLQAGGHHMVFLTEPWSSELYKQAVARLDRQGQTDQVYVHRIVSRETIDEGVHDALVNHQTAEAFVLELMERKL